MRDARAVPMHAPAHFSCVFVHFPCSLGFPSVADAAAARAGLNLRDLDILAQLP